MELELSEQNFGTLFNCPKCASVFFIGWDGVPEVQSLISSEELESGGSSSVLSSENVGAEEAPLPLLTESEIPNTTEGYVEVSENPVLSENELLESADSSFSNEKSEMNFEMDQELNASSNLIQEIQEFANPVSAPLSAMTYDIFIRGIDSAELLKQVRESLSDNKFPWDVNDIMRTLKGGVLEIPSLHPTAAVVLVNRLKMFPLDISWSQHVS